MFSKAVVRLMEAFPAGQQSDIFLQETYSSTETIKRWEAEWGGKVVASHGTTHSKGVMVLFKPNLNVTINKTLADKNGRYILAETSNDETNIVFVNYMHQ